MTTERFFSEMFAAAAASSIEHDGHTLHSLFEFQNVPPRFTLTLEHATEVPKQGLVIRGIDLQLGINGKTMTSAEIWWDHAPPVVDVTAAPTGPTPAIKVWNQWRVGDGPIQAWVLNDAMMVEYLAEGFRLRCNSGPDPISFEDQVVLIELE